jgi:hypothetical protein
MGGVLCNSAGGFAGREVMGQGVQGRRRLVLKLFPGSPPNRANSALPISIARSTWPDNAKTSVSASPTGPRSAGSSGPIRASARESVCSALASAPTARSRRPASSSSAPARAVFPETPASSAASTHHVPGKPGCTASTAARARPASSARSGGSRPASTASCVSACRNRKPSQSAATSCKPTACRNAAATAASGMPITRPRIRQSNLRPTTASITRRELAASPSSRRRTASANVPGTPAPTKPDTCQWPSRSASDPSPIRPAKTSSTRNGRPSARSATSEWTTSGSWLAPTHASAIRSAAAASSRPGGRTTAEPWASSTLASPAAAAPSSSRSVPTNRTRSAAELSARYSSNASVSRSAHRWPPPGRLARRARTPQPPAPPRGPAATCRFPPRQ